MSETETVEIMIQLPKKTVEAIEFLLKDHKTYDGKLTVKEFIEEEMKYDVVSLIDAICGEEGIYPYDTIKKYNLMKYR